MSAALITRSCRDLCCNIWSCWHWRDDDDHDQHVVQCFMHLTTARCGLLTKTTNMWCNFLSTFGSGWMWNLHWRWRPSRSRPCWPTHTRVTNTWRNVWCIWQRLDGALVEVGHSQKRVNWVVAQDVFQDKMIVRLKCFAFLINNT